jgi:hypothetical protein
MKPLVLPASTGLAALSGALSILVFMVLKRFGIELSPEEQGAITVVVTVLAGHFTTDSPPAPLAREAVADAADKADAADVSRAQLRDDAKP